MLLITFSGLDGCGKTTHVARTVAFLKNTGHRVRILESAHVSLGALWSFVRRSVRKEQEHRSEAKTGQGNSLAKHQRTGTRTRPSGSLKGWLIYPIDCLVLSVWIRMLRLRGYTALVCDRYVFDQIVNLSNPDGVLTRLLLWIAPKPDVAICLDANAVTARQRRPEHEVAYYTSRHEKYGRLRSVFPAFTSVPSTTVEEVQRRVEQLIDAPADKPALRGLAPFAGGR